MTSAHFIFIPGVLMVGTVIGFILGGRAARDAYEMERRREEERAVAKEARDARKAAKAAAAPAASATPSDDAPKS